MLWPRFSFYGKFYGKLAVISRQKFRHVTPVASPTGLSRLLIGSCKPWMPCILIFHHPLCIDQNLLSLYLHVIFHVYPQLFFAPQINLLGHKNLTCCSLRLVICAWRLCNFFWRSGFCEKRDIPVWKYFSKTAPRQNNWNPTQWNILIIKEAKYVYLWICLDLLD